MRTPQESCIKYRSAIEEEGEKKGLGLSAAFMRDPGPPYQLIGDSVDMLDPPRGILVFGLVKCRSRFRFRVDHQVDR